MSHDIHCAFRIVRGVATAVTMLAVLAALLLGTLARTSGSGAVRLFGREVRPVLSGSMSPAYRVGDALIAEVASPERIAAIVAGDVITFRVPGRESMVVAHRVVRISTTSAGVRMFTTKGDANTSEDSVAVDSAHVIGVVTNSLPYVGRVMNSLEQRRTIFIFIFGSILAALSVSMARRAKRFADAHHLHVVDHLATPATDPLTVSSGSPVESTSVTNSEGVNA